MREINDEIIGRIEELLYKCGDLLVNPDRGNLGRVDKAGHANFVTKYDKMVQEKLKKGLNEILPEAAFVGEEEEEHSSVAEGLAFIIDPIDGTTNFVKNMKASVISIGITRDGKAYAGVIYNPFEDEMYTGIIGKGAFCNGKPISVSDEPLSNGLVLFGASPYYEELNELSFKYAYKYFKEALDLRRSGTAAYDLCTIASGRGELFFELKLSPWDYAAGAALVTAAGGVITDIDGGELRFDRPCSVLATNKTVRESLNRHEI